MFVILRCICGLSRVYFTSLFLWFVLCSFLHSLFDFDFTFCLIFILSLILHLFGLDSLDCAFDTLVSCALLASCAHNCECEAHNRCRVSRPLQSRIVASVCSPHTGRQSVGGAYLSFSSRLLSHFDESASLLLTLADGLMCSIWLSKARAAGSKLRSPGVRDTVDE